MSSPYNPAAWYWTVTGHSGHVFSSALPGYVVTSDAGYVAWVALGNTATGPVTADALAVALANNGLGAAALAAAPASFADVPAIAIAGAALVAGVALTSTGTPALDATYELAGPVWDYLLKLWEYGNKYAAFPNAAGSFVFPARSGNVTFSTIAEVAAVMQGLMDYRFAWLVWAVSGGSAPAWGTKTIA